MSIPAARGQLKGAINELMVKWYATQEKWDDPVSRKFEQEFLVPIERAAKPSMHAMEKMAELVHRARKECE